MAGNENFRSSITLTTTRSTGASVARTRRGGGGRRTRGVHRHQSSVRQDHAAQTPALHRCHERHHVPHHSIYRVHGGGLRSHRGRVSIAVQLPGLATTTSLCPLKLARKCLSPRRAATWRTSSPPASPRQNPAVHGVQRGFVCYQTPLAAYVASFFLSKRTLELARY